MENQLNLIKWEVIDTLGRSVDDMSKMDPEYLESEKWYSGTKIVLAWLIRHIRLEAL